ncbi:mannose-6-phosphate isomerase, class I [Streptacidiphilus monticola]|uniref:mannose-6-phosphate isomerase n=1 Tax=Streptacidiphilus monticola TaxID=2161674 RepID=A0ABW1G3Q3_9ACTN
MDRLHNTIRPYAWGSRTAIAELTGRRPGSEPEAELWMGAHPGDPSRLDRGDGLVGLDAVIAADPEAELGRPTVERFGQTLPFLFKILAAGEPLSIQVHPNLEQARAGFADEESRGVPLDARQRNYKDPNHKPEAICALTPFTGLCGFRSPAAAAELLELLDVDELAPVVGALRTQPANEALRQALVQILGLAAADAARIVPRAAAALREAAVAAEKAGDHERAVELADYADVEKSFPGDVGVLAGLLLNHVRLVPGQALYLGAGVPHAYLHGLGVELMANSDNVLRAGLTPKHIDVPELLKVTLFEPQAPAVLRPEPVPDGHGEQLYPCPIDEFRLSRYQGGTDRIPTETPQILLCTAGTVELRDATGAQLTLRPGESAFLPAGAPAPEAVGPDSTLFRATVRL